MRYFSTSSDVLLTLASSVLLASWPALAQAVEPESMPELAEANKVEISPGEGLVDSPSMAVEEVSIANEPVEAISIAVENVQVQAEGVQPEIWHGDAPEFSGASMPIVVEDAPTVGEIAEETAVQEVQAQPEGVQADVLESELVEADEVAVEQHEVQQHISGDQYGSEEQVLAQAVMPASNSPGIDTNLNPPQPLPEETLPELPPANEILPTPASPTIPGDDAGEGPSTINVTGYVVEGSTVFGAERLAEVTEPFVGDVSFSQLLQARSAVTQLYVDNGYVTSGAFIPPQTLEGGIVKIQVLEGKLEDVRISGTNHLHPYYVRTRLERAGAEPLNVQQLLEGLKLLQLDPLLGSISADLQAGIRPGTSLLDVTVTEADPFTTTLSIDNGRSPSVGSLRRKVSFSHANLLGIGDGLTLSYSNTDGSDALDLGYTVPLNARNGTLRFAYGRTRSEVIEDPFEPLQIQAKSIYYEGTYRQPVYQTASEEVALGVTLSRQESRTKLGFNNLGGFSLSPGANDDGETKISALRFFQEWSKRSSQQVLAARSQLSVGTPWFESNQSEGSGPDSNFVSWRGQGQWVRLLAPETLMLVRGDLQFADRTLVPLEQFGIGGQSSVRGYRQDSLLTDNGLLMSAEVRLPVARIPSWDAVLQVAPFFDLGHGWNKDDDNQPDKKTLTGTGLGLIWRQGNNFSARLDWGIPLVDVENDNDTLQEKGVYFSVNYTPF